MQMCAAQGRTEKSKIVFYDDPLLGKLSRIAAWTQQESIFLQFALICCALPSLNSEAASASIVAAAKAMSAH